MYLHLHKTIFTIKGCCSFYSTDLNIIIFQDFDSDPNFYEKLNDEFIDHTIKSKYNVKNKEKFSKLESNKNYSSNILDSKKDSSFEIKDSANYAENNLENKDHYVKESNHFMLLTYINKSISCLTIRWL